MNESSFLPVFLLFLLIQLITITPYHHLLLVLVTLPSCVLVLIPLTLSPLFSTVFLSSNCLLTVAVTLSPTSTFSTLLLTTPSLLTCTTILYGYYVLCPCCCCKSIILYICYSYFYCSCNLATKVSLSCLYFRIVY